MGIQQVAQRYYELIQKHNYHQIQDELYAPDALSIEPNRIFCRDVNIFWLNYILSRNLHTTFEINNDFVEKI